MSLTDSAGLISGVATMTMNFLVAVGAQCDQVVEVIIPKGTAKPNVVDLKLTYASAVLAFPPVSFENFSVDCSIGFASQLDPRSPWPD